MQHQCGCIFQAGCFDLMTACLDDTCNTNVAAYPKLDVLILPPTKKIAIGQQASLCNSSIAGLLGRYYELTFSRVVDLIMNYPSMTATVALSSSCQVSSVMLLCPIYLLRLLFEIFYAPFHLG
jgi:hypothetical protein